MTAPDVEPEVVRADPPAQLAATDQPAGRRLHPVTPFLRSWKWVVAAVVVLGRDQVVDPNVERMLAIVAVVAVVGVLAGVVSWRFTSYRFDGDHLRIDSGVLARRSRRVRLDRLQAVDVVRPLVARVVGVSELRLEVAGGQHTEAPLAYLSDEDAQRLRAELLARAAGLDAATPTAPERPLVSVPLRELVLSTLVSGPFTLLLVGGGGLLVTAFATGRWWLLGAALPVLLGLIGVVYERIVASFGFTVSESPDGLRIRRGLLATRSQTVPPGRVQGVAVIQPVPWRWFGWVRLEVDVAGYSAGGDGGEGSGGSAVLLPVAPRPVARWLLGQVLPGTDPEAVDLVPAPRAARWLRPIGWRHLAAGADDRILVTRQGWLTRRLTAVPHAKTQSVRVTQGPLQRRLGLATAHVDTTPGPVDAVALHRSGADARALLDGQVVRARQARLASGPERWMRRPLETGPMESGPMESGLMESGPMESGAAEAAGAAPRSDG